VIFSGNQDSDGIEPPREYGRTAGFGKLLVSFPPPPPHHLVFSRDTPFYKTERSGLDFFFLRRAVPPPLPSFAVGG